MIRKTYDPQVDAFYISRRMGKVAKTENKGDYLVDYDSQDRILGYEILNYCDVVKRLDAIDGIPLSPPWEATTLGAETNSRNKSTSETTEVHNIYVACSSKKTEDRVKQFSEAKSF